ncbi:MULTISPECIES: cyclopropane fatty acyl phospholipid synthase [unclassified Flavobacterium]|uniref:cyclopropane fatty acyl phospholipid synthase n=1 Tax=unclassified Flavobacterium TaxID=196869 RepID=UPI0025B908E4|nr:MULTISPECIES: cyclopropane fatty acyl phospholipid synthase [unclassified Flavobacterium]
MKMNKYKAAVQELISETGITINGNKPYDIQVHNPKFYQRVLSQGSLGVGESYMEGWWDCEDLDTFFNKIFTNGIEKKLQNNWKFILLALKAKIFNLQTKSKALQSIAHHYDIGNLFYKNMLDPLMMYSCGYWEGASTLSEAQEQKLKLICEKLQLKPGQKILDIGCGWGGFAYYAAKNYKVNVVGITISTEQQKLAIERCKGLDVEIRFQDYRDIDEQFDRIVSIGMLEHVGYKNYGKFMKIINKNLTDNGLCLLHFIASNKTDLNTDPWFHKYIFPSGLIPSLTQIGKAMEEKLLLEDLHNIGLHYYYTLMAWQENFKKSRDSLKKEYNETFYRMWNFYLATSAASFRSRRLNLWQIVVAKPSFQKEYKSVRF